MGRHVKRASRQKIAWFRKKLGPLIEGRMRAGYTVCVQDEAICVAGARLRKVVYTPKGVRGVPRVHGIALQDRRVRPDHAGRGGVLPEIRLLYREGVCRVPEGRMRKVREDPDDNRRRARSTGRNSSGRRSGAWMAWSCSFLPLGCPDLNAIEEAWRQMKHAILDAAVRPVQLHVQRHRQVAEAVPAKT